MGSSNSKKANNPNYDHLKLATVRKSPLPGSEEFDLFISYEKDKSANSLGLVFKEIYTFPKNLENQVRRVKNKEIQISCDFCIDFEDFLMVRLRKLQTLKRTNHNLRINWRIIKFRRRRIFQISIHQHQKMGHLMS